MDLFSLSIILLKTKSTIQVEVQQLFELKKASLTNVGNLTRSSLNIIHSKLLHRQQFPKFHW